MIFCHCCYKEKEENEFRKKRFSNVKDKYCKECVSKFSRKYRKQKEFNYILNIMKDMNIKDIDE